MSNIKTYTIAPQEYDSFGTVTITGNVAQTKAHEMVRVLETPPAQVPWQRNRYRSGMYVAVGESEWQDLVAYKLVVLSDEPEERDGP